MPGIWRFVSLTRAGQRYVRDSRPGQYFLEWWEGLKRLRETAGSAPSEALETQRRKVHELLGKMVAGIRTYFGLEFAPKDLPLSAPLTTPGPGARRPGVIPG